MNKKRNDILLVGAVFLVSVVLAIALKIGSSTAETDARVVVKIDGKIYQEYSLQEEQTVTIDAGAGQSNILKISDGRADITEATCPDKLCVTQKEISKNGEMLVCLPNKVTVEIKSGSQADVDAVAD